MQIETRTTNVADSFQLFQAVNLSEWLLIDNQSSVSLFCNPKFVTNITNSTGKMIITTNAGDLVSTKKAIVPGYGEVWYNEKAITNILSQGELTDRYRVTLDSSIENATVVHLHGRTIKFPRQPNNLYAYRPMKHEYRLFDSPNCQSAASSSAKASFLETVEDNARFFTQQQFERAKRARQLLHTLGCPTIQDLKMIVQTNAIRNCPVTLEDININVSQKIFGEDVASRKGKTTRMKPAPGSQPYSRIARHKKVEPRVYRWIPFLSMISRNIMYRTLHNVARRSMKPYRSGLQERIPYIPCRRIQSGQNTLRQGIRIPQDAIKRRLQDQCQLRECTRTCP